MSSGTFRDYFVPLGEWRPDSIEFDSSYLAECKNLLPIYSGYRPMAKLVPLSTGPDPASAEFSPQVTGTYVHRTSEQTGVEVLQPATTRSVSGGVVQVPTSKQPHAVVSGLVANDLEYVRIPSSGSAEHYSIGFGVAAKTWDQTGSIEFRYRWRLPASALGSVTIRFSWGYVDGSDVEQEVGFEQLSGTYASIARSAFLTTLQSDLVSLFLTQKLYFRLDATLAAQSLVNFSPDGTRSPGEWIPVGAATIHQAVDKVAGPDDTLYAQGPQIDSSVGTAAKVFGVEIDDAIAGGGCTPANQIKLRVRTVQDTRIIVRLMESFPSLTPAERQLFDQVLIGSELPQDLTLNISGAACAAIIDRSNIYVEVGFALQGTPTGVTTYKPFNISFNGDFTRYGAAASDLEAISDGLDSTGMESSDDVIIGPNKDSFIASFNLQEPPASAQPYLARLRIENDASVPSSNSDVQIEWKTPGGGSVEVTSWVDVGDPIEWLELDFTSKIWKMAPSDWQNMQFRVNRLATSSNASNTQIVEMEVVIPSTFPTAQVMEVTFRSPGLSYAETSWINSRQPLTTTVIPGDTLKIYVGTNKRIHEILAASPLVSPWPDVSKGAVDYTENGGKSWSFDGFGDKVIATNFIDPVQVKEIGTTQFRDLIGFDAAGNPIPNYVADGGEYPKARFYATINSFGVLASINEDSFIDGRPYTVWTSRISNPNEYYPADEVKQSSILQIVSRPGEVTALLGGEFGFIMKEDSLFRMEYIGRTPFWNFPQISIFQGCPYPRSIVRYGQHVFFWGSGGIFIIENGVQLREIGEGKVSKFLFDSLFEDLSLIADAQGDERPNSAKVIGDYDPYSGLIVWSYQSNTRLVFKNGIFLTYNPQRDQFTVLLGEDLVGGEFPGAGGNAGFRNTGIQSIGNRLQQVDSTMRSMFFIDNQHGSKDVATDPDKVQALDLYRPGEDATYDTDMETNVLPSSQFPGAKIGEELVLHAIRPVYRYEPSEKQPEITIVVTAGQDPILELIQSQTTALLSNSRDDGYITLDEPISGEFFHFKLLMTEFDRPATKEILGIQVQYNVRGER